jgi:signal transduction histidine kinase
MEGNYKGAYEHYKEHINYRDSLFNVESIRKMTQTKMQYDFGKIEDSLKIQQQLTEEKLKQQNMLAVQQQQQLQLKEASIRMSNQQTELNHLAFLKTQSELETEQSRRKEKEKQLLLSEKGNALQEADLKLKTTALALNEKQLEAKKTEGIIFIAGAFVFFAIGFLLWRNYRVNRIIALYNMRSSISADLHDEVGASLTSISIFSEIAKKSASPLSKEAGYLERIGERSRDSIEKMSDIIWSINPENDTLEQMLVRMKNYATEVAEAKDIVVHWTDKGNLADTRLRMEQRKNFYLLFKEVINNAIKHAAAKNICIQILAAEKTISLIIEDDGKGFNTGYPTLGNGLKTIHTRARFLQGKILVSSEKEKGTAVNLQFPF